MWSRWKAGASAVETQNATVGATVSGDAISELPLNGRNTLDLLATEPGVTPKDGDAGPAGGGIQHRRRDAPTR
jgi:hypothetical protein